MRVFEHTLDEALDIQAEIDPAKVFMYIKERAFTYGQTHDLVSRLAASFLAAGLRSGDRVGLMLPRTPELIISFLAATRIGALPVPVNYLLPQPSLVDFIRHVAPKVLISTSRLVPAELAAILVGWPDLLCIDIDSGMSGWTPWRDTLAGKKLGGVYSTGMGDTAYLNYTTGSIGQPKGALASHANIYWNTRAAVDALKLTETDVHLCMFGAFAHPHELFARALYTGGSLVLLEEINPRNIIATINRYGVTCMMGLAPMYEAMARHCADLRMASLRVVESGGMITRTAIHEQFYKAFGRAILSVWGSTETSGIALANTPDNFRSDGSIGRPCPYYQVKLIDEDGEEVLAENQEGELCVRGPGVISGYINHSFAGDEDGWYHTGDIARVDSAGFFTFLDRQSGMIKVAGLKVYPLQVELALIDHPKIAEIAVVGLVDRRKGLVPKAFVVLKEGMVWEQGDLLEYCRGRLPSYMIPKEIEIMKDLPKIGSGKINRKALAN